MDKFEMSLKLMQSFPDSFLNPKGEFIAHKRSNTYLIFANCETLMDLQCKILEWFSRAAYKTEPYYTDKSNNKFHRFMLDGINDFLGTEFTFDDMELIYTYLGNAVNHSLTVEFVESGYDMEILRKKYAEEVPHDS